MFDTAVAGQLDLLAMAAEDTRIAAELSVGVRSLYSLRCSRPQDYLAAFDDWKATYGQLGSLYHSHAWHPAMCGPGHDDTVECAPAILEAHTSCDHDDPYLHVQITYRRLTQWATSLPEPIRYRAAHHLAGQWTTRQLRVVARDALTLTPAPTAAPRQLALF